jgi:hypothetical protein
MGQQRLSDFAAVHVNNLGSIVADGRLWSDSIMSNRQGGTVIGMNSIKQRRLHLPVTCHPGTYVGDYVPFYFCSRSIMLFVIRRANHPDLAYRGGQEEIIHLEGDLYASVRWANANAQCWAFSLSNAGAVYTQFRNQVDQLGEINWGAVAATDFRDPDIKEGKQAEFLIQSSFPWQLVERVGVQSLGVRDRVLAAMKDAAHRPTVEVKKEWYY